MRAKVPDSIIKLANTPLEQQLIYEQYHGKKATARQRQASAKSSYTMKRIKREEVSHYASAKQLKQSPAEREDLSSSYQKLEKNKTRADREGSYSLNWQKLGEIDSGEMKNMLAGDHFQVDELIAEEDLEDKEYLSVFNLNPDNRNQQRAEEKKKNDILNYGKMRISASPLARLREQPPAYYSPIMSQKKKNQNLIDNTRNRANQIQRNDIKRYEDLIQKRNRPGR